MYVYTCTCVCVCVVAFMKPPSSSCSRTSFGAHRAKAPIGGQWQSASSPFAAAHEGAHHR